MDGRTNTRTRGTKSRGRERRPRRKEGRKEREKIKDKRQLTSVTWPLCWLLFLLCAFWESNSATGQLTDPCRFRLSDSPLPLFSSLSLTPSNFLSASLMASLLSPPPFFFPSPPSLSLSPFEGQLVSFNTRNWRQIKLCCISGCGGEGGAMQRELKSTGAQCQNANRDQRHTV